MRRAASSQRLSLALYPSRIRSSEVLEGIDALAPTFHEIQDERCNDEDRQKEDETTRRIGAAAIGRKDVDDVRDHCQREWNERRSAACDNAGGKEECDCKGTESYPQSRQPHRTSKAPYQYDDASRYDQVADEKYEVCAELRRNIQRCPLTVELSGARVGV